MNATMGDWLFSTLGAQQSRALSKFGTPAVPHPPIQGVFHPNRGAEPNLLTNPAAFQARYELPLSDLWGSEIGEGAVPDKSELQARVRQSDNPCSLSNHQSYVVTEVDVSDLRYVAKSGRPVWDTIRALRIFDPQGGGGGGEGDCPQRLQAANAQIASLQAELATKNTRIGQLDAEVARLKALVPVAVPADVDKTITLLKEAGPTLAIGAGVKARFSRLGRFIEGLKTRKP